MINRDFCKPCEIYKEEIKHVEEGKSTCCRFFITKFAMLNKTCTDGCKDRIINEGK